MNVISWLVFIPLQILFLPLTVLGTLLVAYKQILVSKRLGISMTTIEVINGRWSMHVFGMRDDQATARLAASLPNTSLFGLWLSLFPLWVKYKISGRLALYPRVPELGSETLVELITSRTLYFDRIIHRVLGTVEQFVVMGAGYDARAYGEMQKQGLKFFELDQPAVQRHKKATLEKAGISSEHVNFVAVDFEKENMFEKLIESGFDTTKKTLFLWEGVTLYLSEEDVRKTIQDVRRNSVPGSVLLADFYGQRFIDLAMKGSNKKALNQTGEGLKFGLNLAVDFEEVFENFIESESLQTGEAFYMGSTNKKGPFTVVAELLVG